MKPLRTPGRLAVIRTKSIHSTRGSAQKTPQVFLAHFRRTCPFCARKSGGWRSGGTARCRHCRTTRCARISPRWCSAGSHPAPDQWSPDRTSTPFRHSRTGPWHSSAGTAQRRSSNSSRALCVFSLPRRRLRGPRWPLVSWWSYGRRPPSRPCIPYWKRPEVRPQNFSALSAPEECSWGMDSGTRSRFEEAGEELTPSDIGENHNSISGRACDFVAFPYPVLFILHGYADAAAYLTTNITFEPREDTHKKKEHALSVPFPLFSRLSIPKHIRGNFFSCKQGLPRTLTLCSMDTSGNAWRDGVLLVELVQVLLWDEKKRQSHCRLHSFRCRKTIINQFRSVGARSRSCFRLAPNNCVSRNLAGKYALVSYLEERSQIRHDRYSATDLLSLFTNWISCSPHAGRHPPALPAIFNVLIPFRDAMSHDTHPCSAIKVCGCTEVLLNTETIFVFAEIIFVLAFAKALFWERSEHV